MPPQGAYYIMAGIEAFGADDDVAFARHLVRDIGVATVPGSSFFQDKALGRPYVRFCFCKREETLDRAADRLRSSARSFDPRPPTGSRAAGRVTSAAGLGGGRGLPSGSRTLIDLGVGQGLQRGLDLGAVADDRIVKWSGSRSSRTRLTSALVTASTCAW